jgi:hypothetical protein
LSDGARRGLLVLIVVLLAAAAWWAGAEWLYPEWDF